jgi:DNA repair protein RecO (recombination protein O)
MNWNDVGFLISKNKYNENSLISEIFTKNHGKISGIIFGGTSKKIKNYLQIGNQIHINYNSKSENKIGYFKIEIEKAFAPIYFEDQKKLSCIISTMQLIKLLTASSQSNIRIYELLIDFYKILETKNWIKNYIFWELELLKVVGYELKFENLVDKKIVGNKLIYFSKSITDKKIVPNFLIDKTSDIESISSLLDGLKIIGDYLDKTILKPNNLNHPLNRSRFINTLR